VGQEASAPLRATAIVANPLPVGQADKVECWPGWLSVQSVSLAVHSAGQGAYASQHREDRQGAHNRSHDHSHWNARFPPSQLEMPGSSRGIEQACSKCGRRMPTNHCSRHVALLRIAQVSKPHPATQRIGEPSNGFVIRPINVSSAQDERSRTGRSHARVTGERRAQTSPSRQNSFLL
jgi:hypothetical protein